MEGFIKTINLIIEKTRILYIHTMFAANNPKEIL